MSHSNYKIQRIPNSGFTLIEMIIVVAIIAILAAIAVPIYQKKIMESRRTAAKTALFDLASREEKYYSTNNQYTDTLADLSYTASSITVPNGIATSDFYKVTVVSDGTTFTATAEPINSQSSDACGKYSLTQVGVQSNAGGSQTTGCW